MDGWRITYLLGRPSLSGYVSFREGKRHIYIYIYVYIYMSIETSFAAFGTNCFIGAATFTVICSPKLGFKRGNHACQKETTIYTCWFTFKKNMETVSKFILSLTRPGYTSFGFERKNRKRCVCRGYQIHLEQRFPCGGKFQRWLKVSTFPTWQACRFWGRKRLLSLKPHQVVIKALWI